MTPVPGLVVANRFRLIRELGSGNMGSVWLADHLTLDVKCAVKLMAHAALSDSTSCARFQLEAKSVAQLQSPHIVRVLDYDGHDDTPFIAMEFLEGEDLGARIRRLGRLDAKSTYRVISEIAHGLSKAHAAGIVHRDLKPENIFLARTDDGEVAKLLDFGIAKVTFGAADTGTVAGTILGTPQYMSPEQVRGTTDIDHRSDLWSLAVVAYECLLGQLPFDSPALGEVFAQILVDPIPVPSRAAPSGVRVPPGFDRWWARAAARQVAGRFPDARAFTDALAKALGIGDDASLETTPPPFAVSSTGSGQAFDLPVRHGWRMPLYTMAAAAAVGLLAVVGHARSEHRDPGEETRRAPAASLAIAPPAEEASPPAPDSNVVLAPIPSSSAPRPSAAPDRAASAPRGNARAAAPRSLTSRPWAPARPALPAKPAATRPSDDVDFGI